MRSVMIPPRAKCSILLSDDITSIGIREFTIIGFQQLQFTTAKAKNKFILRGDRCMHGWRPYQSSQNMKLR